MVPLTLAVFITTGELREQVQQSLNDDQIRIVVTENDHFHWAQFLERIERVGADAVLLDIAQLTDSLEENIRSIKTIVPAAVQTAGVVEAKLTASPELAVAVSANAEMPKLTLPGWGNKIVWVVGATVKLCVTGVAAR